MPTTFQKILITLVMMSLWFMGCDQRSVYEHDIQKYSHAISIAKNSNQLAKDYNARARAYSEKARYSFFRKFITKEQYIPIFDFSIVDHNKAIEINPNDAELYYGRGMTYYFRAAYVETPLGSTDNPTEPKAKEYFELALLDFDKAIQLDPHYFMALDMKGLVNLSMNNYDQAIIDFTKEMTINPTAGKPRLSDAYCNRGSVFHREKKYTEAISDYQNAIALYNSGDGCSCEPFNPLVGIYIQQGEFDQGLAIVNKAKESHVAIDKEIIKKLKNHSR